MDFSSLLFLQNDAVIASKTKNLTKILLLISRILLLAILVFLFALPFDKDSLVEQSLSSQSDIYCWVDPTISMTYQENNQSISKKAYTLIDSIYTNKANNSRLFIYNHSKKFFHQIEFTRELYKDISPRYETHNFSTMYQQFITESKRDARFKTLIIFSDFQKRDRSHYEETIQRYSHDKAVLMVPVNVPSPFNHTIEEVKYTTIGKKTVEAALSNSHTPVHDAALELSFEQLKSSRQPIDTLKNGKSTLASPIDPNMNPQYGIVSLLSPQDPFPIDNKRYFLNNQDNNISVLHITENSRSLPISSAIKIIQNKYSFTYQKKHPLSVKNSDIDSADIIICSQLTKYSTYFAPLLRENPLLSHKVILFSPELNRSNELNKRVFSFLEKKDSHIYLSTKKPLHITIPHKSSLIWNDFPRDHDNSVNVYNYIKTLPGDIHSRLTNTVPFMTSIADDNNNYWILFSTPLGISTDNNLPETGIFLPLVDRVLSYSLNKLAKNQQQWIAGKSYANPFYQTGKQGQVFSHEGKLQALWKNQPYVMFPIPNIYKIVPESEPPYYIAVHIDSSESNFTYQIPTLNKDHIKSISPEDFLNFIQSPPLDYSAYLWIFFIIFLLSEVTFLFMLSKKEHKLRK